MATTTHFAALRALWVGLALAASLLAARAAWQWSAPLAPVAAQPERICPAARLQGVNWVAADSAASHDLEPLVRAHVTWIAQTPFGWQAGPGAPAVQLHTGVSNRHYWGESDQGLVQTAQQARQRGICTLLKPHLWVRGPGAWPGDINMASEADWQAWFASYSAFVLHYAQLAEAHRMEALCIGTELQHASVEHEAEWRALIRRVRRVYHGRLTYAANWSGEFEQIRFWDALDYIGIQAYFPLSGTERPSKAALLHAWREPLRRIRVVQRRYGKPVLFTEVGYKATPDAAVQPWAWPDHQAASSPADTATQRRCYEALFETFWPQPWFGGVFIWKWYPGLPPDPAARRHLDFTPQHKPAERVMARWYGMLFN